MIKRIISLFLILTLVGSFGTVSAKNAVESVEYNEDIYVKTQTMLEAIGVFDRYDNPQKSFEDVVTRAEFISMYISSLFPAFYSLEITGSDFIDVNTQDASYKAICIAEELGIISGNGNGFFRPDEQIKYEEALKIVISILGYCMRADLDGGYPLGYYNVAANLELDKDITADEFFSYGDCLVLMRNALNTQVNEVKNVSGTGKITFEAGETLMYNAFKVRHGEGVLKENAYTSLAESKSYDNKAVIGDFVASVYGGVDSENYIGYDVEYYYQEDDGGDYIVYMSPTEKNDVISISSEDGISVSDRTISYYPEGKSKRVSEHIPGSVKLVYNGKAYPEYTMDIFKKEDADFKLIDNNNDGKIDVVCVTAWDSIYIDGIDLENERLIDKYDSTSIIELEESKNFIIWNQSFEQLNLSEITTGMVCNFVESLDGEYIRVIVVDDRKSGTIDSIFDKNGNIYLSVDGTEYVVSKSYLKKGAILPAVGSRVTVCLDYTGRIAAIESVADDFEYGYIIKAFKDVDSQSGDAVNIKLLKANGVVSVMSAGEKCKVDGKKYSDELLLSLNNPQVIRYKVNENEVITEIDTAVKGESENENSLRALTELVTMKYYPQYNIFAGTGRGAEYNSNNVLYCMLVGGSNTKFIMAPPADAEGANDEDYMVQPLTYFTGSQTKVFQGFNANPESYVPDVVFMQNDGGGNLSRGDNPALVKEVIIGLNSDDEPATLIKVVNYKNEEKTLYLSEKLEESGVVVEVGDFINYSADTKNNINQINIVYSNKLRNFHTDNKYGTQYYGSDFNPHYGKVYDKEGNMLVFTTAENIESVTEKDLQFLPINNSMAIYVVEKTRSGYRVVKGTVNDIYDYKHYGTSSDMFFYTFQAIGRMMVVYR